MPPFIVRPVKLEDCQQHGTHTLAELFIVEGDSASGAVTVLRNAQFQACLPMQGKPLNAIKAGSKKVMGNELFLKLSLALGVPLLAQPKQRSASQQLSLGLEAEPQQDPLKDLRFSRVLLLFDPDADGIHIGALMLMFFSRWMQPLLTSGRIEMVRAPLFEITWWQDAQPCKESLFAYSLAHCQAIKKKLSDQGATRIDQRHFRGLGSIDQALLSRTCIDPKTRLTQVMSLKDAEDPIEVFGNPQPG